MSKEKPNLARTLIQSLGGPTKVAERLGYDKTAGGVQRVANWQKRGIPSDVLLRHPDIFGPILPKPSPAVPADRFEQAVLTLEARHG